jgi:hypothetical protein
MALTTGTQWKKKKIYASVSRNPQTEAIAKYTTPNKRV